MEIEAKFSIADQATFQRLIEVQQLAGYGLSPARLKQNHDQYLDTADSAFLRRGFACRLRLDEGGGRVLTLKSLTPPQGALHVRQELEVALPPLAGLDMAAWPASDAAALAQEIGRGQPLRLLFDLRQERHQRLAAAAAGGPPLVELSIDHAHFSAAAQADCRGVELELLPAGDLAAVQAMAAELETRWGLAVQPRSKFEQGLALARPELLPLSFDR